MKLFGQELSKTDLMKRVGDISQIAGIKQYELKNGRGAGVNAVDVKTNAFDFTVLLDRGMDIAWADYKSTPLSFISKTGIVSPDRYNEHGIGFLRSFTAGLLTTCGLTYFGAAGEDEGEALGLHGRISNIPADDVGVYAEWEGEDYVMKVRGKMRESRVFGENITLTREISTKLNSNELVIRDRVENCGFNAQPYMLMYHCNFGYPIVSENTVLVQSPTTVSVRDDEAAKGIDTYNAFEAPTHDYAEQVFYHDMTPDENGMVTACLFNKTLGDNGLGAYVRFNKNELKYLIEWKQVGEGEYVVGLEPSTNKPEGRSAARKSGELEYIRPGEVKEIELRIGVTDDVQSLGLSCE